MKIRELRMDFDQGATISIWALCSTRDECDEIIAWLQMAKANMKQWEKIHANAGAPRAAKTAAGQDENPQQGKVLSET